MSVCESHLSLGLSVQRLRSGVEITPQRLYWPSPIERETSNTPNTRPSLLTHMFIFSITSGLIQIWNHRYTKPLSTWQFLLLSVSSCALHRLWDCVLYWEPHMHTSPLHPHCTPHDTALPKTGTHTHTRTGLWVLNVKSEWRDSKSSQEWGRVFSPSVNCLLQYGESSNCCFS